VTNESLGKLFANLNMTLKSSKVLMNWLFEEFGQEWFEADVKTFMKEYYSRLNSSIKKELFSPSQDLTKLAAPTTNTNHNCQQPTSYINPTLTNDSCIVISGIPNINFSPKPLWILNQIFLPLEITSI